MIIHRDIEQGSPEWFALRRGKVTSSKFSDVMAKGQGKTRLAYLEELAFERYTGKSAPSDFKSFWMDRGNEVEAQARAMYSLQTGKLVEQIAFIEYNEDIGASTDGLIKDGLGLCEFKCPKHTTHLRYLLDPSKLAKEYHSQTQGELFVSGSEYVDLVSYHPDFPPGDDLIIYTVKRDPAYLAELKVELGEFVTDLKKLVYQLQERKNAK